MISRAAVDSLLERPPSPGSPVLSVYLDVDQSRAANLNREFEAALQIAEQILNGDPNSAPAHRLVVEAAAALDMPRTAVLSLEILARNSPKDLEVAIKFANGLADAGEPTKAEKILASLQEDFPGDNDLAHALKNISARKTMDKGGYEALAEGKGSYRDILKNKEEAVSLEQENRQVKTEDTVQRLIDEKELRIKTEPKNVKLLKDLAVGPVFFICPHKASKLILSDASTNVVSVTRVYSPVLPEHNF